MLAQWTRPRFEADLKRLEEILHATPSNQTLGAALEQAGCKNRDRDRLVNILRVAGSLKAQDLERSAHIILWDTGKIQVRYSK